MSIIATGTAVRITPLDANGNPTGEPIVTTEAEVTVTSELDDTAEECRQWSTTRSPIEITFHLDTAPFLKQWRKTLRNMARLMRVPPYVVMNDPSCPRPSPAAHGYQRRIKARRRRNRK